MTDDAARFLLPFSRRARGAGRPRGSVGCDALRVPRAARGPRPVAPVPAHMRQPTYTHPHGAGAPRGTVQTRGRRVPPPAPWCEPGGNDNLAKSRSYTSTRQYAYFQIHLLPCSVYGTQWTVHCAGRGCAGAVPPTSQPSLCRCRLTSRSLCRAAALCCSSLLLRTAPLSSGRLLFLSLCVPLAVTSYLCLSQTAMPFTYS